MEGRIKELISSGTGRLDFSVFEEIVQEFENSYIDFKSLYDFRELTKKGIDKNAKKNEIVKKIGEMVSAFANYEGGIVVFGVKEVKKNKERKIEKSGIDEDIIPCTITNWLSRVVASSTEPNIQRFCIKRIKNEKNENYYLIVVDKSESAPHQAKDFKYYGRFDDQNLPLRDMQIRDIINRKTTPNVRIRLHFKDISSLGKIDLFVSVEVLNDVSVQNPCVMVTTHDKGALLMTPSSAIPPLWKITRPEEGIRKRYLYAPIIYARDEYHFDVVKMDLKNTRNNKRSQRNPDSLEITFVGSNSKSISWTFKVESDGEWLAWIQDQNDKLLYCFPESMAAHSVQDFENPTEGVVVDQHT